MRTLLALARADWLERVRRSSFLVVLAFVVWLAAGVFTGDVVVRIGDAQGAMSAAWAGGMMTLVAVTVLSLAGFWVVRNAVERDERTGVGEILATTPLGRATYTLGKAASHFAVLVAMLSILCVAGVVLFLASGAPGGFAAGAYFAPFVLVALPALAITAACAMAFETTPPLRGGAGSAIWMSAWSGILVAAITANDPWLDPFGVMLLTNDLNEAARAHVPGHRMGLDITLGSTVRGEPVVTFPWAGVAWTPALVASRALWLAAAAAIAVLAAVPFHRFDPARGRARTELAGGAKAASAPARAIARGTALGTRLRALLPHGRVGSELRLLLAGGRAAWWFVALGLLVAGFVAPATTARGLILPLAWLWPLTRFAELGARERRHATAELVFATPRYVPHQTLAVWAAGVAFALLAGSGVALRMALAGDGAGLAGYAAGALFVPALALALGTLSGTPRLFEGIYVFLWYLGPSNRVAALDYTGATAGSAPAPWILLAILLVCVALVARARQRR
jgi:hypothetical protein